jgi:hypothetical protein
VVFDLGVIFEFSIQRSCGNLAGKIVFGRAKAPGRDNDVERFTASRIVSFEPRFIITDDRL